MTLERLIETGSGALAVRLVIEGLAYEFVSDPGMEKTTADGRKRICVLPAMGEGIVIQEDVNIPDATLELGGQSIRLVDNQAQEVVKAVWNRYSLLRYVDGDVEYNATTIDLTSTSGITAGDVIHIGTEAIRVGTVASGTQLTGCTRGYWDSEAKKHWSADGETRSYALVTDRPVRLRGRRAYIYLYGDGDSLQGDGGNGGSPKWRGFVNTEPAWDEAGSVCVFQIASVGERLTSKIGGELDSPFYPRGRYYHAHAALRVEVWERIASTNNFNVRGADTFTGFFETLEEFLGSVDGSDAGSLNHWLQTPGQSAIADSATVANTYRAVPDPTDPRGWTIEATIGTDRDGVAVVIKSLQDGTTPLREEDMGTADGAAVSLPASTGDILYARWADSTYRGDPVGYFGRIAGAELRDGDSVGTYPERRIYLDRAPSSDWESVVITWADGAEITYTVDSVNASSGYIEVLNADRTVGRRGVDDDAHRYGLDAPATIEPLRNIAAGTLADFRDALVVEGRDYANRGTAPAVTSLDLADWTSVVNEAGRGIGMLTHRIYSFAESVDLDELLAAEFQLHGLYPVVEADGKIGLRVLRLPTANDSIYTIDEEIYEVAWSDIARTGQTVNTVVYSRGYNAREDDYTLPPVTVQDVTSVSLDNEGRTMEVEPKSFSRLYDERLTKEEAAELAVPYVGLFGYPVDYVTVHVSWKLFDILLGDVVRFQADHLPDYASANRGIDVTAIVVGREWALGEAHGTLRLLVSNLEIGGYTPTARVTSQTNTSGNTWELTVNHTLYAPTDATGAVEAAVDTLFEVGDKVRILQYDTESPTSVTGTVAAINTSTHVITVDFDATWTPSSSTWELIFDDYATVQASQQTYAYVAGSDSLLSSGNPYVFGP